MKELDVVKLRKSIPEHGLDSGSVGAIVHVWKESEGPFEVEFLDPTGNTIALLTLKLEQLEPA
ncbi:DUF4926 domain-containing protein [Geothrix terrae]|uniref:DUF4926 domain-containing protein n=1 Tax=Geothrix terrae TaxID=2922720 RepID=UPI001FAE12F2|nr:DUF4926 domain-containing protein [Geothrix terrae]